MVNVNKLKGKIVERGSSVEKVAEEANIDRSTFYRKMNNQGETFTIKEADVISRALDLSYGEVMGIFFAQYVARDANLQAVT